MDGSIDLPPWVDLPDLVTELILEHLPLPDYIRFATICQKWRSIQNDHRRRHSPHPPPMGVHPIPWLIPRYLSLDMGFDCYNPLEKRLHHLRFPTTPTFVGSALCIASSRGWLLMLDVNEDDDLDRLHDIPTPRRTFLLHPLTGVVISLPMLSIHPGDNHFGALSSPPYDPDCTIILVSGGSVFMCRSNDPGDGWMTVTMGVAIKECIDSVVYHGGKFYFISRNVLLYVLDRALSTPTLLRLTMDVGAFDILEACRCWLVESDGELLLFADLYIVLRRPRRTFLVFKADLFGEKWVNKMDMLADHVLFLDESCSLSLLASDVGCKKNCIYSTHHSGDNGWSIIDLDSGSWIREEIGRHDRFSPKFCLWHWFLPTLC